MAAQLADLQRRKLRRLMTLVAIFAYGPSALLITIGVLILVFGHATKDVVFGIMTLSLTVTLLGGVALTIVYVRRESSVAQLQTEFVNKVSHDLRTPLTSIRLFVETLQAKRLQDPEKIQQVLDIVATETKRLSEMVERLLGWAPSASRYCRDFATASLKRPRKSNCVKTSNRAASRAAGGPMRGPTMALPISLAYDR